MSHTPPARPCLALLCALLALDGCDLADATTSTVAPGTAKAAGADPKKPELPLVRTEPMAVRDIVRQIKDVGHAESLHVVDLFSRVSGRLEEVLVDEGSEVSRGQVLCRLDQRMADLRVKELGIQVAEAVQAIDEKQLAYDEAVQKHATAEIEEAKKKRDYEQKVKIAADILSPLELDDARVAHRLAQGNLKVAELAAKRAEVTLAAARNAVERIKVQLELARVELAEYTIRSPIDGVISARNVTRGDIVSDRTGAMFHVVDLDGLVCVQTRTQQDLPFVHKGQKVYLTTDAWRDETFEGVIDVVNPVIDRDTGSFKVRIRIENRNRKILPGMFLNTRIVTGQSIKALTLSKRAVLYEGDRPLAWVVRDGRSHRIHIEPGIEERDFLEVVNRGERGFKPDDVVVISGHKNLRDGREVEVVQK